MTTAVRDDSIQERLKAHRIEAEFRLRHGVREFKNSGTNILAVLKSGGAPMGRVREVMGRFNGGFYRGRYWTMTFLGYRLFDHGHIFGRDGKATLLVGHPYGILDSDLSMIDDIRSLNVEVRTDGESFYGFGTVQVLVIAGTAIPT